jgi:crotonobetainyl-CoA:carnitine CoA-transferase CaiB-like acyl-CoA transferase
VIDLPLLEPMISVLGPDAAIYTVSGEKPKRTGSRSLTTSPRNVYETSDNRFIAISASIQVMAERVFRAIGKPEMIDDPRFRTNTDRVRNIDACDAAVGEFIAARTLAENMAIFGAAEVTANPVYEIDQLIADPHVHGRGVLVEAPDEEAGSVLRHSGTVSLGRAQSGSTLAVGTRVHWGRRGEDRRAGCRRCDQGALSTWCFMLAELDRGISRRTL